MSTTTPNSSTTPAAQTLTLPDGVTLGAGRETSQANTQGQIVQGVLFPVTLGNGTVTSVFVPYGIMGNLAQVEALFLGRINGLTQITG
jgi:hypothetical protein